jgi:Domain of unknown function (DUF1735)/Domain of unknown function (DUF4361)
MKRLQKNNSNTFTNKKGSPKDEPFCLKMYEIKGKFVEYLIHTLKNNTMKLITPKTLLLSISIIGLYACSEENNNPNVIAPEVTVSIAGTDAGALLMKNYKLDVARTDSFTVNISSNDLQTKDLSLTLDISQIGLDLQNTKRKAAGEANYTVLPTTAYSISPNPITIKAGTRTAKFAVKVNVPATIDLANDYLLPVGIINVGDAKINSALSFINISIEGLPNRFAGDYRATGRFTLPTSTRDFDRNKIVKTIDKITSETEFADLGTVMWLKVNNDNSVTIIPHASTTSLVGAVEQVSLNKYDPATKTFTLNYQYNVGSRVVNEVIRRK